MRAIAAAVASTLSLSLCFASVDVEAAQKWRPKTAAGKKCIAKYDACADRCITGASGGGPNVGLDIQKFEDCLARTCLPQLRTCLQQAGEKVILRPASPPKGGPRSLSK